MVHFTPFRPVLTRFDHFGQFRTNPESRETSTKRAKPNNTRLVNISHIWGLEGSEMGTSSGPSFAVVLVSWLKHPFLLEIPRCLDVQNDPFFDLFVSLFRTRFGPI